jgi:general secretion pathway protein J
MAMRNLARPVQSMRASVQRGFTLVEVMVALVVMAVLATMAWQGVEVIMRTQTSTRTAMDKILRTNTVLAQWEQDLQGVQRASAQQAEVVPGLSFDGAHVRLTRRTDQGLQLVVWRLSAGRFERWAAPPTLRQADLQEHWLRSQQLQGDEPGTLRALEGVTGVQLYFYQGNAWANAQSDSDKAPPPPGPGGGGVQQANSLPTGVRLVLAFGEATITRDVLMPPPPQ